MFILFIIGTAGSGKSLLTASFTKWLKMDGQDVVTVNLDPGVLTLPYTPDVDVRNYVRVEEIMEKYMLGPNGALVMAADLIAEEAQKLGTLDTLLMEAGFDEKQEVLALRKELVGFTPIEVAL